MEGPLRALRRNDASRKDNLMSLAFFASNSEEGLLPYPAPDIVWETRAWDRTEGGVYEGVAETVSQQNVEVIRRSMDAFNRRDVDGILREWDPDAEVDWSRSAGVEEGIYRGHRALRDFWNTFIEMWERLLVSADEFIDCGESVVVPTRTRFWGREGIDVEAYGVFVVTLRHGRIVQWRLFRDRAEALKAVGLERGCRPDRSYSLSRQVERHLDRDARRLDAQVP
jgi:ketosteroid isomerase-like protein